jgi:hypothetical protein
MVRHESSSTTSMPTLNNVRNLRGLLESSRTHAMPRSYKIVIGNPKVRQSASYLRA